MKRHVFDTSKGFSIIFFFFPRTRVWTFAEVRWPRDVTRWPTVGCLSCLSREWSSVEEPEGAQGLIHSVFLSSGVCLMKVG